MANVLLKHQTVLYLDKDWTNEYEDHAFRSEKSSDEALPPEDAIDIFVGKNLYDSMGRPEEITIAIQPGDTIHGTPT